MNALDHVTIAAASLESGTRYLQQVLGVGLPPGGKHPDMGTHNRVARVGSGHFLELIAIDPEAPGVPRKRWFGLDDPAVAKRLAERPRAVGWVVRTDNLEQVLASSPVDLGQVLGMSRNSRSWRLTVRSDGTTAFDGLVPAFIEWSPGPHPSEGMAMPGPQLTAIELRHPQAGRLREVLAALGVLDQVSVLEEAPSASMRLAFRMQDGDIRQLGD